MDMKVFGGKEGAGGGEPSQEYNSMLKPKRLLTRLERIRRLSLASGACETFTIK
jgi:hypothetical protein